MRGNQLFGIFSPEKLKKVIPPRKEARCGNQLFGIFSPEKLKTVRTGLQQMRGNQLFGIFSPEKLKKGNQLFGIFSPEKLKKVIPPPDAGESAFRHFQP